ncbi:head-tail connector protein (plasmid) [Levilactobacillus brevis]|nr:head-tail connector protein [Levilactobacillus brevis]
MTVTVSEMQEELHLDGEEGILQSLITEGTDYVRSAVNYDVPVEEYEKYPLFDRAVKTYVSSYYYNRSTGVGTNKGLSMMINHLRGRMWGADNGQD